MKSLRPVVASLERRCSLRNNDDGFKFGSQSSQTNLVQSDEQIILLSDRISKPRGRMDRDLIGGVHSDSKFSILRKFISSVQPLGPSCACNLVPLVNQTRNLSTTLHCDQLSKLRARGKPLQIQQDEVALYMYAYNTERYHGLNEYDLSYIQSISMMGEVDVNYSPDGANLRSSTSATSLKSQSVLEFRFASRDIKDSVIYASDHSLAFISGSPALTGHVIVAPRRQVPQLSDLTSNEVTDLFMTVQKISNAVQRCHGSWSSFVVLKDGRGQPIEHVHVHVLPHGEWKNNREKNLYEKLEEGDKYSTDKPNEAIMKEVEKLKACINNE